MWVKDEWSGGDAVAVTRKNSYTGLVYYNNIPSAITDDFGLNAWVTTDMKTLMYCKRGITE